MYSAEENANEQRLRADLLKLGDVQRTEKVDEFLKGLRLNATTLRRVQKVFTTEMNNGLNERPSSLQMENTYLPELPDGTENGKFLALDLGGTNFRVLLLEIIQGQVVNELVNQYHISDEQRVGCGVALFDYLAECIGSFVRENGLEHEQLSMGFTFSFPMTQHSLNSGSLLTWTKSFKCSGVGPEKDVVQMLTESLSKAQMNNVQVMALLNDTTGTLVAGARMDHRTNIAMIVGTGSNACYMEKVQNVSHWETKYKRETTDHVVIDVEWGAFGDNGTLDFVKTPFDVTVDRLSLIKSSFTFEKYISGKYMGELVRAVLDGLVGQKLLAFDHRSFSRPNTVVTADVSLVEQDNADQTSWRTEDFLRRFGVERFTDDDVAVVKHVCALVSHRAAQLLSACLAVLLEKVNKQYTTVAVDGSVFKHHPRLRHLVHTFTSILAPKHQFEFILAQDGSGKGAGFTAAVAKRLQQAR